MNDFSATPNTATQRHLQRDLRELEYTFRSLQLFLEHVELRFARLLEALEPLVPAWAAGEERRSALETELESTCQEVGFLQREIKTLERILARQDEARDQRWQARVDELEQAYRQLEAWLDASRTRLEALEETASSLLEVANEREERVMQQRERIEALRLQHQQAGSVIEALQQQAETLRRENQDLSEALARLESEPGGDSEALQRENARLSESIAAFEQTEQEYLQLLETREQALLARDQRLDEYEQLLLQQDRQLQQLNSLYESELGQLSAELSHASQDQQSRALQSQDLGRSLARLAQERNTVIQHQQTLNEQLDSLAQENRQLQRDLQLARASQHELESIEQDWHSRFGPHLPLEALSYCHFWETAAGLQLELPESLYMRLAESLRLAEPERRLLEQRLRLQPGRLMQLLQDWRAGQGLSPTAPAAPGPGLLRVPAGSYPVGDDLHPAERPAHRAELPGFEIARLPVSNADFARFMAAGGYQNPDFWLPEGWAFIQAESINAPAFWQKRGYACGPDYPDYPVFGVSWYEAVAYATWADLRLPSEVEWEAAGRGPEGLRWPWGEEWRDGLANTAEAGLNNTTPVGLFPEGASPYGLLDLVGNVFEWTASVYKPYPYRPDDGREDLRSPEPRSLRGCSWNHRGHYFTRLSYRFQAEPTTRHSDIGFRVAG